MSYSSSRYDNYTYTYNPRGDRRSYSGGYSSGDATAGVVFVCIYFGVVFAILIGFVILGIYKCFKRRNDLKEQDKLDADFERAYQAGRMGNSPSAVPMVSTPSMPPSQQAFYGVPNYGNGIPTYAPPQYNNAPPFGKQ
jgi:hypothetical protein